MNSSTACVLALGLSAGCTKKDGKPSFSEDIEPITRIACVRCHDQEHVQLNLLDQPYRVLMKQGLVVPGKPEESRFYLRVKEGHPELTPLSINRIEQIQQWIDAGAAK